MLKQPNLSTYRELTLEEALNFFVVNRIKTAPKY